MQNTYKHWDLKIFLNTLFTEELYLTQTPLICRLKFHLLVTLQGFWMNTFCQEKRIPADITCAVSREQWTLRRDPVNRNAAQVLKSLLMSWIRCARCGRITKCAWVQSLIEILRSARGLKLLFNSNVYQNNSLI